MYILYLLNKIIESRKLYKPLNSYITLLFKEGKDKILKKIGEESIEIILAAKNLNSNKKKKYFINECADLILHLMVILSKLNIKFNQILNILNKRLNLSGIEEKKNRKTK